MLFNSYIFIFIFLPISLCLYYATSKYYNGKLGVITLVFSSLAFYGYWNPKFILLIIFSILTNYCIAMFIQFIKIKELRKVVFLFGVIFNIGLLFYFKYVNFFIENLKSIGFNFNHISILLPLGISFFTFTQIAFLVDCFKKRVNDFSLINYFLFVTFFPHLLAGPILHHSEMMPQFGNSRNKSINLHNLYTGMVIFSIGLFKKAVVADYFATNVDVLFNQFVSGLLTTNNAWSASLGYSLQLYYDFSGYTDMAIGVALLFNIVLPINFNSPYKSVSVKDFWRRWHITLSRFLKDYIYIPLGGNRGGKFRTEVNVFVVFLVGGFWHGAGWNYIVWGALHAIGYLVATLWELINTRMFNVKINRKLSVIMMFLFINFTWVFFRAESLGQAINIVRVMFNFSQFSGSSYFNFNNVLLLVAVFLTMTMPNSAQITAYLDSKNRAVLAILVALIFWCGLIAINLIPNTPFIYFQF